MAQASFDTAIFIDVENLIGGYGGSRDYIENLKLTEIVEKIRKSKLVGQIGIQRAYANWSNSKLSLLRLDILHLGIDPIQIFGFSHGNQKNSADIHLALDVIDVAYQRTNISTFVLVSGDGAFASVAKRLHEYGRLVVGCAMRQSTNKVFQTVCDDFVWLEKPRDENMDSSIHSKSEKIQQDSSFLTNIPAAFVPIVQKISTSQDPSLETAVRQARLLVSNSFSSPGLRSELRRNGLIASSLKGMIVALAPNFDLSSHRMLRFLDFCRYAFAGTDWCILHTSGGPVIQQRSTLNGREPLEDLSDIDLEGHTATRYRAILAQLIPNRSIRIPLSARHMRQMLDALAERAQRPDTMGEILEDSFGKLDLPDCREDLKGLLISLRSIDVLKSDDPDKHISEQKLRIEADLTSDLIFNRLKEACEERINSFLGSVDADVMAEILPLNY